MGGWTALSHAKTFLYVFFFYEYTHISSSRGHMGLIRLPAHAPLSHLQNPAEVKVFLPPFIPAQTPGTWKQRVFVINVEVVLLVQAVYMAAGCPWWCNNRWIMREAACRAVILPDFILTAHCANMCWWLQEIHLRHCNFFVTQFFMKSIVSLSYSNIKY